jgi:hypothetical protein
VSAQFSLGLSPWSITTTSVGTFLLLREEGPYRGAPGLFREDSPHPTRRRE